MWCLSNARTHVLQCRLWDDVRVLCSEWWYCFHWCFPAWPLRFSLLTIENVIAGCYVARCHDVLVNAFSWHVFRWVKPTVVCDWTAADTKPELQSFKRWSHTLEETPRTPQENSASTKWRQNKTVSVADRHLLIRFLRRHLSQENAFCRRLPSRKQSKRGDDYWRKWGQMRYLTHADWISDDNYAIDISLAT